MTSTLQRSEQALDPWVLEARRTARTPAARPPQLGPVRRRAVVLLGGLAALRGLGLVLVADALARGIAGLAAGGLTGGTMHLVLLGAVGALLRAGAQWATTVVARRMATDVKCDLRGRLWRRIVAGDTRSGSTAVLASDGLDALDDYYVQSLPALVYAAVVPLLVGVRILAADWVSALVIVLTVPLVPLFMVLIGKHTQQRTARALAALARLADHLTELARGLPVLVGLGRVEEQTRALETIQRSYRTRTQETLRWAFLSALALELVATISVAVVAVFLGLRLLTGTMTLGPALLALVLAPECFNALREVGTAFHASQDGQAALEKTRTLLAHGEGTDVRAATGRSARPATPGTARPTPVHIDRLTVRYAGRSHPALEGVCAALTGIVAVTGPSGAGKSTLLSALTGTLPPDAATSGTITGLRACDVAWAPQAPRAFAATPREELALYGAANPMTALDELGLAHCADAAVAELSPGELRRLAVARALARADAGARLLVLDEPTAHLDSAAADQVRAAILRRASTATVVLASHECKTQALATSTITVGAAEAPAPVAPEQTRTGPARPEQTGRPAPRPPLADLPRRGLTLRSLLRPHRWGWAGAVALGGLGTSLGLALTALSGWLIVRASVEEHIMYLMVAIVGVRAFGIGRSAGRYSERLATHRVTFEAIDELRLRLWRAIAERATGSRRLLEGGAPLDYLVTLADELRDQLPRVVPPLAVGLLVLFGTVTTTALVAPHLLLPVALTLTVSVLLAAVLTLSCERGAGAARIAARSRIVRGSEALAAAAVDLRGNDVAARALARLDAAGGRLAAAEHRAAWAAGLGTAVVTAGAAGLAVAVPVLSIGHPAEQVSVIALLSLAVIEPLTELVGAVHRIPALREILARLSPILQPVPAPDWGEGAPEDHIRQVALEDVTVHYPGAARPAVAGATGTATTEHWLVLDGPSGSGKSTLLSAIMGALRVSSGSILADGRPLPTLREQDWRTRVAWCPQDAYAFSSTIRGNLLLARSHDDAPDDAALTTVLTRVGLGPLMDTLPDGLDTRVGPGGTALSGGERQRLAVARALLTSAGVVLLDEPTAHLDPPTAAAMMADVRAATAGRVVVLVSHRREDRRPGDTVVSLPAPAATAP